ncbi:MAG: class I SAM-dependent DNA methyltransferase [Akkermansia sp.]|nr:class I SAM-dependent DNA methyltransferase [Akkermansia sp.]
MAITLSQNEISARAAKFAGVWKNTEREEAEAQSFLIDFFHVLGVDRKKVAIFEHKVKCTDGGNGYIDLFWKGKILIEMKSRGKDLTKAYEQAKRYAETLSPLELPKAILVCDFENWHLYDLAQDARLTTFSLSELPQYIHLFHFLAGYEQREYQEEDPVNVQAAELLGKLHDRLKEIGYIGHPLEVYLVRLLFCLFAEDTGIFRKDAFRSYILNCTAEDGRDLAPLLAELFQVLNTPQKSRLCTRNEAIKEFPYINGGLFAEFLPMPAFDADMRQALLNCCALDWSTISPAIFGSMFQSVMDATARRALGAHYTSERNILKLINPLFMDALREEFELIQHDKSTAKKSKLAKFHKKISELTFLDPACGCGNFLVVAYRELRRLELAVIAEREKLERATTGSDWMLSANDVCLVNVNQFYGIEIEDFPAQIAQVAMWLMDHLMNIEVGNYFGEAYARIPLIASASIVRGNALQIDWETVVPKEKLNYIMGNPPFSGARFMSKEQKGDLLKIFNGVKNAGDLDFVTCWFKIAATIMQGTNIKTAFVATNSVCQGQSVAIIWKHLKQDLGIDIHFAYRTFKWRNESKGVAGVHCVIVGFSCVYSAQKIIFDNEVAIKNSENINGYLTYAPDIYIENRNHPICSVPEMAMGNQPIDNSNYLFSSEEKEDFLKLEPAAAAYFHPWLGAQEFINNKPRHCLYIAQVPPHELKKMPHVLQRIEAVRLFRLASSRASTLKLAAYPTKFQTENIPTNSYIAIPQVSSERRDYIPMGFLSPQILCSDKLRLIPHATLYHFGVLTSSMHMAWTKAVCGRLKSDYQYSAKIVYNNFPWPETTEAQQEKIAELAQGVLDARTLYPNSSLADLYDPLTMPVELVAAHRKLDAEVERAYGRKFGDDAQRVAYLFEQYSKKVNS